MSTTAKKTTTTQSPAPETKEGGDFKQWLDQIYDPNSMSQDDLMSWNDVIAYRGFNREKVLRQFRMVVSESLLAIQIIILIAVRGPQKAAGIELPNKKTLRQMGIQASGGKGNDNLTCQKIGAATADIAAYYLKKLQFPKRLNVALPGWLQFPSAGSIKLPADLREQHKEFAIKFSAQIGGTFNDQIYSQMILNEYISNNLRLFE
jgi:hypothetical protein